MRTGPVFAIVFTFGLSLTAVAQQEGPADEAPGTTQGEEPAPGADTSDVTGDEARDDAESAAPSPDTEPSQETANPEEVEVLQELNELSLGELLQTYEVGALDSNVVVWSASKRAQRQSDTASGVIVITGQQIEDSGVTNLGDLLRTVAGVDVREAHAGQHVIGIRGFADTQHVLVTIDGNNAFMYHANHIFFDWMPVSIEQIDRIEIMKGPASVLYGGNAFSGIINIYTKSPAKRQGTRAVVVAGNRADMRAYAGHAGKAGALGYSADFEFYQGDEWKAADIPQERRKYYVTRGTLAGVYDIDKNNRLSLSLMHSEARNVISRVCQPSTTMLSLRYERPEFWARGFLSRHKKTFWNDTFSVGDTNLEFEALYSKEFKGEFLSDIVSAGGYAKRTQWYVGLVDGSVENEEHGVYEAALNAENELRLGDVGVVSVGGRLGYYSMLGPIYMGRAALVLKPGDNHALRASASLGYYLPSLFEHTNEGTTYPFSLGNEDLLEEQITSFEVSYTGQWTEMLSLNLSGFFNLYKDLIDNSQAGPQMNVADAQQYGGEIELKIGKQWLHGFANYSYQYIDRDDFGELAVDPRHKVNAGVTGHFGKWTVYAAYHWVDVYYEIFLTSNPVFGRIATAAGATPDKVDPYHMLNLRIAHRPMPGVEIWLAGFNSLAKWTGRHYESNSDTVTGWHTGDPIGYRVTAGARVDF